MSTVLTAFLTILVTLVNVTSANFDLYNIYGIDHYGPGQDYPIKGWQIFNDDPKKCRDINPTDWWNWSNDLSHGRLGVRCEGKCGLHEDPHHNVKELEMHFTNQPLYHFTIYEDKGHQDGNTWMWTLFGVDGQVKGECFVYSDYGIKCDYPTWEVPRELEFQRKFRCLTEVTASEIKSYPHSSNVTDPVSSFSATASVPVSTETSTQA